LITVHVQCNASKGNREGKNERKGLNRIEWNKIAWMRIIKENKRKQRE
jgi:hypothetical protein